MSKKHAPRTTEANRNLVPKRQWAKWNCVAKRVFNEVYETMAPNPDLFSHPKAKPVSESHFNTTAWNAAWTAAEAVKAALKDIAAGD